MKISFAEVELDIKEKEKTVNYSDNKNFDKYSLNNYKNTSYSLPNKINCIFLYPKKEKKLILICCDIVWFSTDFCNNLKIIISQKYNTSLENIVFSASHTHGTLNTDDDFKYGKCSDSFNKYLVGITKKVVKNAHENQKYDVYCQILSKEINDVSVNRRKIAPTNIQRIIKGKLSFYSQNFPNYKKQKDNRLVIINFLNKENDKILAIFLKFTCHPISDPTNCIGSDYPGYLKEYISNHLNNQPMVFFMQGFAGDVRPNLIYKPKSIKDYMIKLFLGNRFREAKKNDSKELARKIYIQVKDLFEKQNIKLEINHIKSKSEDIDIGLEKGLYHNKKLNITVWNFKIFKLLFLSGEILSGYALKWDENKKIIGIGYSNGMTCYIPTSKDLNNGGYEVNKSREKFNVKERIDINFTNKLKNILEKIQNEEY